MRWLAALLAAGTVAACAGDAGEELAARPLSLAAERPAAARARIGPENRRLTGAELEAEIQRRMEERSRTYGGPPRPAGAHAVGRRPAVRQLPLR